MSADFDFSEYLTSDYCFSCAYFRQQKGHFGSCYEDPKRGIYDGTKQGSACGGWRVKTEWGEKQFKIQELPFPKRTKFTVKGAIDHRTWNGKNGLGTPIGGSEEEKIHEVYARLDLHKVEIHRRQRDEQENRERRLIDRLQNRESKDRLWAESRQDKLIDRIERMESKDRIYALGSLERQETIEARTRLNAIIDEWRGDPILRAKAYLDILSSGGRIVGALTVKGYFLESVGLDPMSEEWQISERILQLHCCGWSFREIQGYFLTGAERPLIDLPDLSVLGCIEGFHQFCSKVGIDCSFVDEDEAERRYILKKRISERTLVRPSIYTNWVPFTTFWRAIDTEFPYGVRKQHEQFKPHLWGSDLQKARTFFRALDNERAGYQPNQSLPRTKKIIRLGKRDSTTVRLAREYLDKGESIQSVEQQMRMIYGRERAERTKKYWQPEPQMEIELVVR